MFAMSLSSLSLVVVVGSSGGSQSGRRGSDRRSEKAGSGERIGRKGLTVAAANMLNKNPAAVSLSSTRLVHA